MEEKHKIDVALFRYSVIHDFVSGISWIMEKKKGC